MDLERLANRAKQVIDERGGVEALKQDAEELRRIAEGDGTLTEKAKAAAEAIKVPGDATAHSPSGGQTAPRPDPNVADVQDAGHTPGR